MPRSLSERQPNVRASAPHVSNTSLVPLNKAKNHIARPVKMMIQMPKKPSIQKSTHRARQELTRLSTAASGSV